MAEAASRNRLQETTPHRAEAGGRIAMVAYTHFDTDPRCRREAALAVDAGWEVHFFALSRGGHARTITTDGITLHELPQDRYRGDSAAAYITSYLQFLCRAAWAVEQRHRRRRFDVVHVNTMPDFMIGTALLPRLTGAKVILDIHDVMPEIYMTKFRLPATHWKIRLIKAVELLSTRLAHMVLTAEHTKRDLLVEHGVPAGKIEVLLNLPDERIFPPRFTLADPTLLAPDSDPAVPFRLIYHGTIAHRLGMDNAIGALSLLCDELPGATLRLFGDGDQLPELHEMVSDLGLSAKVWFSDGFLPIEQIIPDILDAHLAVLPTRHEISTDYMLPTKFLEYLVLGIPALVTPTRTVRYYFGDDHPFYIQDPTPEATAAKILWARHHYGEVKRLTAALQAGWLARYHWPKHRLVYLELLQRLTGRPARAIT